MLKGTDVEPLNWTVPFISLWKDLVRLGTVEKQLIFCEGEEQRDLLLSAFLLKLFHREHHVNGGPLNTKATLWFMIHTLSQLLQPGKEDSGDDFAYNTQKRDTPVVSSHTVWWCSNLSCPEAHSPPASIWWSCGAMGQAIVERQCFSRSGGMLSFPGALPGFNCLMACISSSIVGSASSSSSGGRLIITVASRAEDVTKFCLE